MLLSHVETNMYYYRYIKQYNVLNINKEDVQ